MQFQRAKELANATPMSVLRAAWGASASHVEMLRIAPQHMTIQEAGDLAAAHGLELPDILAV